MDRSQIEPPGSIEGCALGRGALLAIAAALLGLAVHIRDGLYSPYALALLAAAYATCVGAAIVRNASPSPATMALLAIAVVQLLVMPFKPAGASEATVPLVNQRPYWLGLAVALAAVTVIAFGRRKSCVAGFVLLLVTYGAIGVWKIRTAPQPRIDVFTFHVYASAALADGRNPYAITFPNIYGPDEKDVYGTGVVRDGRLQFGYPYPPLVLFWIAPAQLLLGDCRYAQLLAMLATGTMIAAVGRSRGAMLAAAVLLFTPRSFYVLEMAWTEPLSAMLLAATILSAMRYGSICTAVMLGLLIASKQYLFPAVALVPLLARRDKWMIAGIAITVAAIVTLPLALWDLRAFVHSAVTLQFHQPYRDDSLSFLAWWGSGRSDWRPPQWLALVTLAAAIALSLIRAPKSFALGFALCFFSFFAFNKQAFANYYCLVLAALCAAAASAATESCSSASDSTDKP